MPKGFKKDGSYAGIVFEKGNSGYWLGKKRDKITCLKIGLRHKGNRHSPATEFKKGIYAGKNHYNWQGGITSISEKIRKSIEYKKWRRDVFIRDEFTCQDCGKTHIYIVAHHIKDFSKYLKLRLNINNGKTLCKDCHKEEHTKCKTKIV